MWCGICIGKSSEDTYGNTYLKRKKKKKKIIARSVGQYFPRIQVHIMKKRHLAAKSVVQEMHREVI